MSSGELTDTTNDNQKETENGPKSFRAEYARKTHNTCEKKRKDKIAIWIDKINELLPKDSKKESKNGILEKTFHYLVHLKATNDKLIYGNADQAIGEELRQARKRIKRLEDTNAVYYKLLKLSGITPSNVSLDDMDPDPVKSTNEVKRIAEKGENVNSLDYDGNTSDASDATEVIGDETENCNRPTNITSVNIKSIHTNSASLMGKMDINPLLNSKQPLLVVNQNPDHNAPRISLSNGSQLQIRPSPNVQILGNGALAIDSSGFNQGPIILGSTLLSSPQPTTLLMHNGQLISLVNQPQPAFVYNPGAGFVLTSSTPINNTSINVPDVRAPEQPEKNKRKTKSSVSNETENEAHNDGLETMEQPTNKAKRARPNQKSKKSNNDLNAHPEMADPSQPFDKQTQSHIMSPPKKRRGRPSIKVAQKAKETVDKLTSNEVNFQSDEITSKAKPPRPTTVIERVTDSPVKRTTNKHHSTKGNSKDLGGDITDLDTGERLSYSYRQNPETGACESDQLPLLLDSLSEDHEISSESVHSVSNSSLPTFLSLSPSDHLTDFLSKTTDHSNGTNRSPRFSSPLTRMNSNAQTSQTPSVIISNQGANMITDSTTCQNNNSNNNNPTNSNKDNNVSLCVDDNYTDPTGLHHHHQQSHIDQLEPQNTYQTNPGSDTGQGRLYPTNSQTTRRRTETDKNPPSQGDVLSKSAEVQSSTSSPSAVSSAPTNNNLDSNTTSQTTANNSVVASNQERNFLPYSAESLLKPQHQQQQQSQQQQPSNTVPVNSIYHVHSNAAVDPNLDFSNRGVSSTSTNANVRPNISYSAERLIHTPPIDSNSQVSSNPNNMRHQKQPQHDKGTSIPSNNNSSNANSLYNEQYTILRNARGNNEQLDSDLSRLQGNNQHHHHQTHHHQQQQQPPQHTNNLYRSSPQAHEPRANQPDQHTSRTSNTQLNANNQANPSQQQQIMHQHRNSYSENHLHHHQQPQPQPPPSASSQQSRGHQSTLPNQSNSNSQGQLNMKTTSKGTNNNANSSPTTANNSGNNNDGTSDANNGRELFNHHYPYGSTSTDNAVNERNANLINFTNPGNVTNEGFIENSSINSAQNNFLPSFTANNNCQPPSFGSSSVSNNRRPSNSATGLLHPFNFSDPSFTSDSYNRQAHLSSTASSNSISSSGVNFVTDPNRRIVNSGHFADHSVATSASSNNPSNNYFMVHNHHHVPTSSLPISSNSTFTSLISSSSNNNFDSSGYNLSCSSRSSGTTINSSSNNLSQSTNSLSNSNLHHHHHHSHHHPVFYTDSTLPSMHPPRRPLDSSSYTGSNVNNNSASANGKSTNTLNNNINNGSLKTSNTNNTTASTGASKQSGKSNGGSSTKSNKKSSTTNTSSKSRTNNPPVVNSYSSFVPPPPPPPAASAVPVHNVNRSVASSTSSNLLNISGSSDRTTNDPGDSLFRPQPQSNPSSVNMQPSSTSRSASSSGHGLPPPSVGGPTPSFLSGFNFINSNFFPEISTINANDNFPMSSLSAIKFNPPNHVLPHHPNPNAPFTHSSGLPGSGPVDNNSGSMGDNSSHQNIYGHHSRIATPHPHSFIQLIGTSPRTLK